MQRVFPIHLSTRKFVKKREKEFKVYQNFYVAHKFFKQTIYQANQSESTFTLAERNTFNAESKLATRHRLVKCFIRAREK